MSLDELSRLLQYSAGVTDRRTGSRAAPSAGATYPIETYAVVNNVESVRAGIYHYLVPSHELDLVREGHVQREMSNAALGERMLLEANVVLVLSAVYKRTERRYRERAKRYIHFEAGHIAQNVYLVATAMGLGTCAVGAFYDEDMNNVLGLDGQEESVLYLLPVGEI